MLTASISDFRKDIKKEDIILQHGRFIKDLKLFIEYYDVNGSEEDTYFKADLEDVQIGSFNRINIIRKYNILLLIEPVMLRISVYNLYGKRIFRSEFIKFKKLSN